METAKPEMPDLLGIWKQFLNKSQESMEEAARRMMGTDEFATALEKSVEYTLVQTQMINKMVEQYMQKSPVPSKSDLTRLATQVVTLDRKVDRLETYFEETLEPLVKGLSAQLARLEAQVNLLVVQQNEAAPATGAGPAAAAPARKPTRPAKPAKPAQKKPE